MKLPAQASRFLGKERLYSPLHPLPRLEGGACGGSPVTMMKLLNINRRCPWNRQLTIAETFLRSAGFTVLELLIAITLLTILVAIVGSAIRLGYRSVDAGMNRIDIGERFRNSLSLIDSQVQSLTPATEGEGMDKRFTFIGENRSLRFSTTVSIWGDQKGPVTVSYRLEPNDQGTQSLYASEHTAGEEKARDVMLLTSLDDLLFEYYYRPPLDEEGIWSPDWKESRIIPEKIRIHLIKETKDCIFAIPIRVTATLSQGAPISTVSNIQ